MATGGEEKEWGFRAVTSPGAAAVGLILSCSAQPFGSQGRWREKNCRPGSLDFL